MTEVVSVRFKNKGKVYYFDPMGIKVEKGASVIVETSKGLEFAECTQSNHMVEDSTVVPPLRPVKRIATKEDEQKAAENAVREKEAFEVCSEKIKKHGLEMKLVDVEYNFEGTKILFFFTSDGRVDFRDLVKDLASVFKTRIELRQIGVRDEARMLNGLGICGRPFCCAQFLDDFQPVSIKMAKTQGLSLNPTKISGTCGRLMCCLKYEQEAYEELVKTVPKVDSFVDTQYGKGMVTDVNLLRGKVRVKLEEPSDTPIKMLDAAEVEVLGGKAARAEYLASKETEAKEKEQDKTASAERKRPQPKKQKLSDAFTLLPEDTDVSESRKDSSGGLSETGEGQKHKSRRRHNKKPKPQQSFDDGVREADITGGEKAQEQNKKQRRTQPKNDMSGEIESGGEKAGNKKPFRYRRFRNNRKNNNQTKQQ